MGTQDHQCSEIWSQEDRQNMTHLSDVAVSPYYNDETLDAILSDMCMQNTDKANVMRMYRKDSDFATILHMVIDEVDSQEERLNKLLCILNTLYSDQDDNTSCDTGIDLINSRLLTEEWITDSFKNKLSCTYRAQDVHH